MSRETLLMVADSQHDANMLYAVAVFVPDPFVFLQAGGKPMIIVSDLEVDRVRKSASHCRAISLNTCQEKLRREGVRNPGFADVIARLLHKRGIKSVLVPAAFPLGLALQLGQRKIRVNVKPGPFFARRECKTAEEVKKISAALTMAEVGLAEGIQILKRAKVAKRGKLFHNGVPLTAEKLRSVIDTAIIQAGGIACNTIVAPGRQACDPHERGYGPLRANQPIIIDVFPRSQKTGYFGDITRTVVKGRASEELRKLYQTVLRGHQLAFERMTAGTRGVDVHNAVAQFFNAQGYKTGRHGGRMEGFFHPTGHGLGLEIHEAPRTSATSTDVLKAGHVATVEPGLYYPEIGGVRIEDVAWVTANSPRNLTKFEKVLEV